MKKKKLLLGAILVGLFIAPNAFADTINGSGGWQLFPGALDQSSPPYWDASSTDGSELNIGYYLTKTGGFSGGTYENPGAIPFWGNNNDGSPDPSFYFQKPGPSGPASLRLEIGDNAGINKFGWYERTGSPPGLSDLHPIFVGCDSPITNKPFEIDPGVANYGLYTLYIKVNGEFFLTEELDENGIQHFAVFRQGSTYWIGMEDLRQNVDFDYNDAVVKITPNLEPATMLLLGSGLIGLAGYARRRFKK